MGQSKATVPKWLTVVVDDMRLLLTIDDERDFEGPMAVASLRSGPNGKGNRLTLRDSDDLLVEVGRLER